MILVVDIYNIIKVVSNKGRFIISTFLLLFSCGNNNNIYINGYTMGTTYSIIIDSDNTGNIEFISTGIDSILLEMNNIFSTYIDSSEINLINNSLKDTIFISNHFIRVLEKSFEVYNNTKYSFDPTIKPLVDIWGFGKNKGNFIPPTTKDINNALKNIGLENIYKNKDYIIKKNNITIDFSAIAKGYSVDVIAKYLTNNNYNHFMIEIGGEILCSGSNNGNKWNIAIQNPFKDNFHEIILLNNNAIATSGSYRNYFTYQDSIYSHTIDPINGYPIRHNTMSVSVIADDCLTADAYATGLLVLGYEEGLKIVNQIEGLEAVFIIGTENKYSTKYSENYNGFK